MAPAKISASVHVGMCIYGYKWASIIERIIRRGSEGGPSLLQSSTAEAKREWSEL